MKCSKCGYLGFETGDRCKNCGYDFSLVAREEAPPASPTPSAPDFALPLFGPYGPDDAPLIALPTAPRPPLAVRRTPEPPRPRPNTPRTRVRDPGLRAPSRFAEVAELALNFHEETVAPPEPLVLREEPATVPPVTERVDRIAGRRLAAVAIDYALLVAIDVTIVYFTLRIAGLTLSEWSVLPPIPLVTFLILLKLSYFSTFTAVGGQTIGKMAVGIRVIAEGRDSLDGNRAIQRTLAGALSVVTLGLGFLPALVGSDRRALHDRLARTRVICDS
jgi:uncharacterized RDD family membrane protein YckC